MTKLELLNQVTETLAAANAGKQLSKSILEVVAEYARSSKNIGTKMENKWVDDVEYKFCKRHQQYEKIDAFTPDKNGKLDASCDIAVKQWKEYSANLKKLEKATMNFIDDAEKLQEHVKKVEEAKAIRSGHDYPKDGTEEYALIES